MAPTFLTTGEAAKALGVSRGALLAWARSGIVTPAWTTPGGHMRWHLDDLVKQLRGHPGVAETDDE